MRKGDLFWLTGYFEGQASFTVNIGLSKTKNRRYVVFKPYIAISNSDNEQINHIKSLLSLNYSNTNPKDREERSIIYSLNVQNFDDIDKIIEILSETKFISTIKQTKFDRFVICYKHIKKLGHIHTTWNDEFEEIIKEKLQINNNRSNINKNRFSASQWKGKIIEHLGFVRD